VRHVQSMRESEGADGAFAAVLVKDIARGAKSVEKSRKVVSILSLR
jgi:hypothetical protein